MSSIYSPYKSDVHPIFFSDFHVIKGQQGPQLSDLIKLTFADSTNQEVSWTATQLNTLRGTTPLPDGFPADFQKIEFQTIISATQLGAENITVALSTGIINTQTTASYNISNFIVDVICYDTSNAEVWHIPVRVYIHPGISGAWLTPNDLTIFHERSGSRFHVYGRFSDGVTANITNQPGITWEHNYNSGSTATLQFGNRGYLTVSLSDMANMMAVSGGIGVRATLPTYLGALVTSPNLTTNRLFVRTNIHFINTYKAVLVEGSAGTPANPQINKYNNILFIAEGFKTTEESKFNRIVRTIANSLVDPSNIDYSPWNRFASRLNFWRLFVPSTDSEIGHLYSVLPVKEIKVVAHALQNYDRLIPLDSFIDVVNGYASDGLARPVVGYDVAITTGLLAAGDYTIDELIEIVGLPVNIDSAKSKATKIAEWTTLYSSFSGSKLNDVIFNSWKKLVSLTVLDQRRTFLGTHHGKITSASFLRGNRETMIDLNGSKLNSDTIPTDSGYSDRVDRYALDGLLRQLKNSADDSTIGTVWTSGNWPTLQTVGKDFNNIVVICNSDTQGGSNDSLELAAGYRTLSITVATGSEIFIKSSPINTALMRYELDPFINNEISASRREDINRTCIHELSHSFLIGDEYGSRGQDATAAGSGTVSSIGHYLNIQHHSTLVDGSGYIVGDRVKWRWPRINRAGEVISIVPNTTSGFDITLVPGHGRLFQSGNGVFLRQRELLAPNPSNQVPTPYYSAKLSVTSVAGDVVTVSQSIVVTDYPTGSLLVGLVEHATVANTYLELLSSRVRDFITNTTGTTVQDANNNKVQTGPCNSNDHPSALQIPDNLPVGMPTGRYRFKIVGLYAGGHNYNCGVYHPTGMCIMRDTHHNEDRVQSEFCPVCKYILVDKIDPSQHGYIDGQYYPQ